MNVETSGGEIRKNKLGIKEALIYQVLPVHVSLKLHINYIHIAFIGAALIESLNTLNAKPGVGNLPRMPTASHRFGSSVTPGMGAKVTDTKEATPGADSECVSLCSVAGSGAGVGRVAGSGAGVGRVGEDGSAGGDGGAATLSGCGSPGADVMLWAACGAAVDPTGPGCGVRGRPYWVTVSVLAELSEGEVTGAVKMVGEEEVVFKAAESFPGAGAEAGFRGLTREVGILPPAGGGAVLECWVAPGFLPLNGAGGLLTELGLEVVVVLLDGEAAVFGVDAFVLVGGARGGSGFPLGGEPGFFPTPTADVLVVAVVVAVVVIVAAAAAESTSSSSG